MLCSSDGRGSLILSVDVEDNFTREELKKPDDWEKYEAQVVINTERVIKFIKDINADATFFVVGKVAERHPELVKAIDAAGYEIGSHSYAHEPVWKMTEDEFEADLIKSISILENITNKKVKGFRAMGFSITGDSPWALELLEKHGLVYDSSVKDVELEKLKRFSNFGSLAIAGHGLVELPISTRRILGKRITVSGGIALRLLPFCMYNRLLKNVPSGINPRIIYCHVWEFSKDQPKRKVGLLQSIAQSPLTYTTPSKLRKLSAYYRFISFERYLSTLDQNPLPK